MSLLRRHWPAVPHIQREKSNRRSSEISNKESLLKARESTTGLLRNLLWKIIDMSGFSFVWNSKHVAQEILRGGIKCTFPS